MHILANIGKGGGGKSTLAANLATVAAHRCLSVGLLDADPQGSLCQWRVARGRSDIKVVRCLDGDINVKVEEARRAHLNWLIIDTSPALDECTQAAVRAADIVLLATRPALFDLAVTRRRIEFLCMVHAPLVSS